MSQHWFTLSVVSALALGMAGCDSGPKVVPVSGTITLDGKPMARASITTQPIGDLDNPQPGSGSFGKTDDQGHYSFELVDPPLAGAVVGEHRVFIIRYVEEDMTNDEIVILPGPPWPARYSDGSLTLTVTAEGTTEANFELTLKR